MEILVYAAYVYLATGFAFAVYFSFFAVPKFDEAAKGAGIGFRLIILPGVAALWPYPAWRLLRGRKTPVEKTAHRKKISEERL